jgi:ATP-dependent RNA helicase DOB1
MQRKFGRCHCFWDAVIQSEKSPDPLCAQCTLQEDWGWGVVVSVLRKAPKTNAAVNGGAAIASAAAAAAAGADGIDVDVKAVAANAASCYIVDTLLPCKAGTVAAGMARPQPIGVAAVLEPAANGNAAAAGGVKADADAAAADAGSSAELTVMPVLLPLVTALSSLRVTLPDDIRPAEVRQSLLCVLQVGVGCGWVDVLVVLAAVQS